MVISLFYNVSSITRFEQTSCHKSPVALLSASFSFFASLDFQISTFSDKLRASLTGGRRSAPVFKTVSWQREKSRKSIYYDPIFDCQESLWYVRAQYRLGLEIAQSPWECRWLNILSICIQVEWLIISTGYCQLNEQTFCIFLSVQVKTDCKKSVKILCKRMLKRMLNENIKSEPKKERISVKCANHWQWFTAIDLLANSLSL